MADSNLPECPLLRGGGGRRRAACITAQRAPIRANGARTEADDPVDLGQPAAVLGVVVVDVVVGSGIERRRGGTLTSSNRVPHHARRAQPHRNDRVRIPQPIAVLIAMVALAGLRRHPQWPLTHEWHRQATTPRGASM